MARPFNSPVGGGGTTKAFSSTSFLGSITCMLSPADTTSSFTISKTEWVHYVYKDEDTKFISIASIICNGLSKIWQMLCNE